MKDPKTDATPLHAIDGGIFVATQTGETIDLARHDFVIFQMNIISVLTVAATFRLQDSADGTSFANVSGQNFTEPVNASTNDTRHIFVRERDVRRFVRIQMVPNGGTITFAGTCVLLNSTQPPTATTYSIDTSV